MKRVNLATTIAFVCLAILFAGLSARAETVNPGRGAWLPFLRGNLDFTIVHPLKVFHGHLTPKGGTAQVTLEKLKDGFHASLFGNIMEIGFDEPKGASLVTGSGQWSFQFYVAIHQESEKEGWEAFDLVGAWQIGSRRFVHNVPVRCLGDT